MDNVRFENLSFPSFKQLLIMLCSILFSFRAIAEGNDGDYKFGNVTAKDFDVSSSKIVNPDDGAVVLYSAGSTHFIGNNKTWFNYVYTCTKRIKILKKTAFDLATVKIGLNIEENDGDVLSDVTATTYNLSNNTVSSISIDKNDIYTDRDSKYHAIKKFTLPGVQEGSIIEYTYTKTSPHYSNIPGWQFQSTAYPVLWSEYQVSIPVTLKFVYIKQGFDSFYIKKQWDGKEAYRMKNSVVTANTINYRWAEKDLQPLKIENYFSSLTNYVDKIGFQLSGVYNGEDSASIWNSWKNISEYFLYDDDFKQAVSKDNTWIKDLPEFKNGESELDIAKDIYHFLQNNYTCLDDEDVFSYMDLYDVYKKQRGTVRGINLLLMAMLNNKGIYTEPVLLSTRDNGIMNPNYPLLDNFNYLLCRTFIDGKVYLLDATNSILGFGELSNKCYNGYARIIHATRSDSLYLFTDSLNETDISTLALGSDENGKISGTYKCVMGQTKSVDLREQMKTSNPDEYFKNLKKDYSFDIDMINTKIDSLDQKGLPVSVQYDLNFKVNDDIVYFNPITPHAAEKENPFKAAQRIFPVEMPYRTNKTYILNMQVPAGYKVDELPKSARVALNDDEGMFQYLIQQTDDHIQLVCKLKLNKATFGPDDYETLRNFFAFVVEKESEQIVFKKI